MPLQDMFKPCSGLKRNCTSNQIGHVLSTFINIVLKNDINILKQIAEKNKNGIKVFVGQAILELLIKRYKNYFDQ